MPHANRVFRCLLLGAAVLALPFAAPQASAQQTRGVRSAVLHRAQAARRTQTPPGVRAGLPRPRTRRLGPLLPSELAKIASRRGLSAVGVHRTTPDLSLGEWNDDGQGGRIWRLAIGSEGAAALRVHFTSFSVGQGSVWVYAAEGEEQTVEPFQERGPFDSGDFWSSAVFGEEAIIEYRSAAAEEGNDDLPFAIPEIAHLWESPQELAAQVSPRAGADRSQDAMRALLPFSSGKTVAVPQASLIGSDAASCQVDVACYADWIDVGRAVAAILFESGDGSYACSGTLLNTREQSYTPYFLTAAHCITSNADARTVEAFWNFRSATCNGNDAPARSELVTTLGAQQVLRLGDFDDSRGDFNLLLLSEAPEGAVFAGWDPDVEPIGETLTGIHHPAANQQSIVIGPSVADRYYGVSDNYLILREDTGRTEGGSSGSGLFTPAGELAGVLSFGPSLRGNETVCDINPSYIGYSRFSTLYPYVSAYLEDQQPPPDELDVQTAAQEFRLAAVSTPTLYAEPMLEIAVPEDAVSLTVELRDVTPGRADVDLYVRYGAPPEGSGDEVTADFESISPSSAEQIVINRLSSPPLQTGVYYVRLALYSRFVDVAGEVIVNLARDPSLGSGDAPSISAVVNAASQEQGAVAPGQLVSIYGANLGAETGQYPPLDAGGTIPTEFDGVSVAFDGEPAPLLYVRGDQINAQVPYEIAGAAATQVVVTRRGISSESFDVAVTASAPEIFGHNDGSNRGVVFNQDGSLNSAEQPAARGEIVVFYVTGVGAVEPAMATGELATTAAAPVQGVQVLIGGREAEQLFAAVPPGLAGTMQVNARVPADAITGSEVLFSIRIGGVESGAARMAIE